MSDEAEHEWDGPDGEHEELLESHPRRPSRRMWLALGAVVVIGAAGGLVLARGSDGGDGGNGGNGGNGGDLRRAAPASTTSAPDAAVPAASASSVPRPACLDVGDSDLNCGVSAAVPRSFVIATRTVLPAAVVRSASTVTGRDGRVYSRRVLMQGERGSTLQLRIGPRNAPSGERVNSINDGLAVEYSGVVGRRHIEISLRPPPAAPVPPIAALQRLAQDPRLIAVG